ncbi:folate family ECF transporter S component [Convivina praedatoris]|uniref:Folate transporter FolT n=1 Tax=Convivina praedatoris TaxID=2880963 RepID=A0ABN8HDN0_9LACO|nr:folate family ECF transporter S component [Convivina sp. LMG 32447]CAH1855382.1 Folate transporter FolT [Convivina sp. LMG 32447]CAH1856051.1 Folate transporter FolT [Convivina sp. LMG 32447]CAH1856429.1 Folate transporter FolT [Convivina sp. LMG 32447]
MKHFTRSKWQLPLLNTRQLVILALLMALSIVLGRLTFSLPLLQIGFTFIATSLIAKWYGPLWSMLIAAVMDVLKFFLFPTGAGFFLGFTVSAILAALIYADGYYQQEQVGWLRVIITVSLVIVIVNVGLNSLWLNMMYSRIHSWQTFVSFITPRLVKNVPFLPVQVGMTYYLLNNNLVNRVTQQFFSEKRGER